MLRTSWLGGRASLLLLVAAYLLLAATYSIVNPLFEAPDEIWHYEYVRWLAEGRGLPVPEDVGAAPWAQEGSQPPLYYLLGAALTAPIPTNDAAVAIRYNPHAAVGDAEAFGNRNIMVHGPAHAWPWRGVALAAHLTRFLSILLGAATVACTFFTASWVWPRTPWAPTLAAALVAFNPQFLFISASASNDNLVTAAASATLCLLVYLLVRTHDSGELLHSRRWWWLLGLLGLLLGLGALSKLSGLLLTAPALFALGVIAVRRRAGWRGLLWLLPVGGGLALVAGWWYVRSWLLFGDPMLLNVMFAVLPGRAQPAGLAQLLSLAPGVWRSFWAVFGWFNVVVDEWVYWLFSALTVVGMVGWFVGWLRSRRAPHTVQAGAPLPRVDWAAILLLAGWILLVAVSLVRWAQISYPQGRLLFPALSSFATLLAWGLLAWLPARFQGWGAGLLAVGLAVLAAAAPFRWIQPVYAAPALLPAGTAAPNPVDVRFGAAIRLVGYEFAPTELQPGAAIDVTLYWQADAPLPDDLSVFLHGTDELEVLAAQRDSYPGGGLLPTSQWPAGAIVPDAHRLLVPETAMAPSELRLDVGLYDHRTGARLPVAGADAFTLGAVTLLPRPTASGLPHEADINFGDQMRLAGYDFDRRVLAPGETLTVTLWWEGIRPLAKDYVVFAHLLEPPDRVWAQDDQMPQEGAARTSTWQPGVRVEDRHELRLPAEAPPGVYRVEIGVYDKDSFDRLPVEFSDQGVILGQVRVR